MKNAQGPGRETDLAGEGELCPRCGRRDAVVPKLLLIGEKSPDPEYAEYQRRDQLAADEILPEYLSASPLQQFVEGCYCDRCGVGFVSDKIIRSSVLRARR